MLRRNGWPGLNEVPQHLDPPATSNRLRMELHALQWPQAVAYPHDFTEPVVSGDLELFGQGVGVYRQGVVACLVEGGGQASKEADTGVGDAGRLAVLEVA